MTTAKARPRTKRPAKVRPEPAAAESAAIEEVEEAPGLNLAIVGAADAARHRDGVRVRLGRKWGDIRPALVGWSAMTETIRQVQNAEIGRHNLERGDRKPPIVNFHDLPAGAQMRGKKKIALAALRAGGFGVLSWPESDEMKWCDLESADDEATRQAFAAAYDSLDLALSPWLVDDLLAASRALEEVEDATIQEAKKKGLACGLAGHLARGASQAAAFVAQVEALTKELQRTLKATGPKVRTAKNQRPPKG